jgi:CRP-like cAMP-binding protein
MRNSSERNRIHNRILLALPNTTLKRIEPSLELLKTTVGQVIDHIDGPIEYMYFVNRGLVSVVKTMQDGRTVEVGAVGIEGVTDANALFGIGTAVLDTIVQIPGSALRIRRETLRDEMEHDEALRDKMQQYARFAFGQLAQTAACNRLHSLEERCCRWLLIAHDSALSDTFPLTHEFLAMMLGAQRSGVSIAARMLKRAGLIDYTLGVVTIMDRAGLEEGSCECYRALQTELDKLFGVRRAHGE